MIISFEQWKTRKWRKKNSVSIIMNHQRTIWQILHPLLRLSAPGSPRNMAVLSSSQGLGASHPTHITAPSMPSMEQVSISRKIGWCNICWRESRQLTTLAGTELWTSTQSSEKIRSPYKKYPGPFPHRTKSWICSFLRTEILDSSSVYQPASLNWCPMQRKMGGKGHTLLLLASQNFLRICVLSIYYELPVGHLEMKPSETCIALSWNVIFNVCLF